MGLISTLEHVPGKLYHAAGEGIRAVGFERHWGPVQADKWPKGYTHPLHSSSHSQPRPPVNMTHSPHHPVNFPGIFHASARRLQRPTR